ncbi:MAG: hypothetical protein CMM50_07605 [Rhodospirillaceae bacterium]|nr:hypothetical protein [Rhodospirillaceae bacterium]
MPSLRSRSSRRRKRSGPALRRILTTAAGWTFVLLGIAGLFLPILQGVLFLVIGLYLLSLVSPRARLLRQRLGYRYPKLRSLVEDGRAWLRRHFGRRVERAPVDRRQSADATKKQTGRLRARPDHGGDDP